MEDDLFAIWGIDREKGTRLGHNYLVDVAMAGLTYAREMTRHNNFPEARASKARHKLSEAVENCARRS
jgi:hypothetical protein